MALLLHIVQSPKAGADHIWHNSCSQTGRHNNFTTFCPEKMIPGPFFICLVFQSFHHLRGSPENFFLNYLQEWCWSTLRVSWTARRSNQPILKEINPEHSLEGLMLKLQYFGHLMQTANSLERSLKLGKIDSRRRRGRQRMRQLDGITGTMDMNLGKLQEM